MKNLKFPLSLTFKIGTLSNDFVAQDAEGKTVFYVKQKIFKLVEEVNVFADETQADRLYQIKANQWLDFSASYNFTDSAGREQGRVARKGWKSIWKTHYQIYDKQQQEEMGIKEDNPWIKVGDALLSEVPVLGILSGYFFNPSYSVARPDGTVVAQLKKEPSFFGRKFTVSKISNFEEGEEARVLLSLMMMILLERSRG